MEVPAQPRNALRGKRVSGRSIYIGERDAFFKYIAKNHVDIEAQLVPKDQSKRMRQCLDWHRAVLQPAAKRLVQA